MKKYLVMLIALTVAVAVAAPAFAAVEFKYGGQFRARWISDDNITDGSSTSNAFTQYGDNTNIIDQRLRLYFTFQASKNLKVVCKFEMGDTVWGSQGGRFGAGGRPGADAVAVEVKNSYVEFNIPNTPTTAIIGIQGINLLSSWIVDDDFSAAAFVTKLDPFTITAAYIAGQNVAERNDAEGNAVYNRQRENVDDLTIAVDYKSGPFMGSLIGFWQHANQTAASFVPETLITPVPAQFFPAGDNKVTPTAVNVPFLGNNLWGEQVHDNDLFDLGFNFTYKTDVISAYVNFVKNFGSAKITTQQTIGFTDTGAAVWGDAIRKTHDYTGWMVDAGANYFCGPYTFNLGGFYTTGQKLKPVALEDANGNVVVTKRYVATDDFDFFTYPLSTAKYFSEIVGGGILDETGPFMSAAAASNGSNFWRGYGFPSNLWTVTAGAAWQVLEQTKLSASYWYFQTAEAVGTGKFNTDLSEKTSNDLGHEFDLYITQGIVDGLTLDIVGAYMLTGDAYARTGTYVLDGDGNLAVATWKKDDVYKVGARIQWNF